MIDRENVIQSLRSIKTYLASQAAEATKDGNELARDGLIESQKIIDKFITLLKEQEPILLTNQHKSYNSSNPNLPWISRCPRCGKKVEGKQTRFCKYCGQAVKWDA